MVSVISLWFAATMVTPSVRAQDGESAAEGADLQTTREPEHVERRYRPLIAQALEEFEAGRWEEARALFRRAHALDPNARTLRGVAMASFELREYAMAIRAASAALSHPRRPLTVAQRTHAEDLRARAEAFVARYELRGVPPEARVLVDGVAQPLDGGALVLDLGTHEVEILADERRLFRRRLRIAGGERDRLDVRSELVPEPAVDSPAASGPEQSFPGPRDDTVGHALLVSSAISGALSVGALGYLIEQEVALAQCEARVCLNEPAIRAQRDAGLGVTVGLGALTVGLAVGGGLLLAILPSPSAAASLSCSPLGAGILCAGVF